MIKKNLLLFCSIFLALSSFAQFESAKQIYKSPQFDSEISSHKTVAILPFDATINYKRPPKNYNEEAHKQEEATLSKDLQSGMYTYLLRKSSKYTVEFQDTERTNTLLRSSGLADKLGEITADSLCKILKVDAVIKCRYSYEKTASEGGAIAKAVLFGGLGGKTGAGNLVMQINSENEGKLIWRYTKAMDDNVFSSTDDLIERMMRKVARNFPYEN
ncbi:hypothetical protein [Flavihumibacter sp. ZG627]|uniref:hypothetical protein n=1 Tax=Flavihumibacter sp. ZG627 TaxID=1463156 RepID=UPI0005806CD5|nr:hypothetical protein [Flavihumibacter sp. ZG627]KIC92076.1 hypothetical protein HY58_00445 [Flavihumibacter sp. ZG627]